MELTSDPGGLIARMRMGTLEPAQLRKAVAAMREGPNVSRETEKCTQLLQRRIAELANDDAIERLSRRELREGCKVVLHPPLPPATDSVVLNAMMREVERQKRRAAFFSVIDAYLDGFQGDDLAVLSLAEKLQEMSSHWPWREKDLWPQRLKEFSLLDPSEAPAILAHRALVAGESWKDVLRNAGLDTPGRRFGGLVEAAFRNACRLVMNLRGQAAVAGQTVLTEWAQNDARQFGYPKAWPDFVEASLVPWEIVDPTDSHKVALIEMLERFGGGDPRANPQRWRTIMDRAPAAYAVLMRWLTRASVLQFLDVVDRLMPDYEAKLMWSYRRAFWTSYLMSDGSGPGIDAAWVAFGDEGTRLARRAARDSGDQSFAAFGRQQDKSAHHAALILEMGDLTIVDWSHNARYQVWNRGEKGAPKLFQHNYRKGALYGAPIQQPHSSPSTYTWQRRLAEAIEGKRFFTPKSSWRPQRA